MDSPIAAALRHAAASALPEGAFLRRDRGDALFVSNAPRLCADGDWTLALNRTEPDQPTRGGGLYACALLNFIIKEEETT